MVDDGRQPAQRARQHDQEGDAGGANVLPGKKGKHKCIFKYNVVSSNSIEIDLIRLIDQVFSGSSL